MCKWEAGYMVDSNKDAAIALALQRGISPSDLIEVFGFSKSSVYRVKKELEKSNILINSNLIDTTSPQKSQESAEKPDAKLTQRVSKLEKQVAWVVEILGISEEVPNSSQKSTHNADVSEVLQSLHSANFPGVTPASAGQLLKLADGNKSRVLGVIEYVASKQIKGSPIGYAIAVLKSDWQPTESSVSGESIEDSDALRELTEEEIAHKREVIADGRIQFERQFRRDMARLGLSESEIDDQLASGTVFS